MSNLTAFIIALITILVVIILLRIIATSSPGIANIYRPIFCDGVIGT